MDYKQILDAILKYDIITVYRHVRPDGDAVGSQLGLVTYLRENFPNKSIYVCGFDKFDKYPIVDEVSDELINQSLAIVLDTSNRDRIDDMRESPADRIFTIITSLRNPRRVPFPNQIRWFIAADLIHKTTVF